MHFTSLLGVWFTEALLFLFFVYSEILLLNQINDVSLKFFMGFQILKIKSENYKVKNSD